VTSTEPTHRPIVDCHTHVGLAGTHVGGAFLADLVAAWGKPLWDVRLDDHAAAVEGVAKAIVLAFDAPAIGLEVPNEYVADYVRKQPGKLIGFASVDPARPRAPEILEAAVRDLGLRGLKLGPIYQHFHPHDSNCLELLEVAADLRIPVLWHQGTTFVRDAPLEVSRPALLDAVARRFPELRMWIAHLGHPWYEEAVVTIRKHPHLYADISAVHPRPLQLYLALATAVEYGVANKLLFGTDYPFATVEATIAGLRAVNSIPSGTGFPRIPDELIEAIIHRDTLGLVGLEGAEQGFDRTRGTTAPVR
jgi:uncharacterized protein